MANCKALTGSAVKGLINLKNLKLKERTQYGGNVTTAQRNSVVVNLLGRPLSR